MERAAAVEPGHGERVGVAHDAHIAAVAVALQPHDQPVGAAQIAVQQRSEQPHDGGMGACVQ